MFLHYPESHSLAWLLRWRQSYISSESFTLFLCEDVISGIVLTLSKETSWHNYLPGGGPGALMTQEQQGPGPLLAEHPVSLSRHPEF